MGKKKIQEIGAYVENRIRSTIHIIEAPRDETQKKRAEYQNCSPRKLC